MADGSFNPLALSGDGKLTITGSALNLSDGTLANDFFGNLTVIDAAGITLGKANSGMTMKVGAGTSVTANLDAAGAGTYDFSKITNGEGADGTFNLALDDEAAQTVTLSGMNDVVTFTSTATDKASTVSGWAEGDKIGTASGSSFNGFSYKAALSDALTAELEASAFTKDSTDNKYKAELTNYTDLEDNGIYNITLDGTVIAKDTGAATIAQYFAAPTGVTVTSNSDGTAAVDAGTKQPTDAITVGTLGLSSGSAILAAAMSDSSTGFWKVNDADSDGVIAASEVVLLGVVDGLAVGDVAAGTFAAGA